MIQNEKLRVWVNRVLAFVLGAVLVYAVVSLSIVKNVREENEELKKELHEPSRLLSNAKGFFENRDYTEAKKTLETLLDKHPGASEIVEGKQLYTEIEAEQNELNRKWEAAVGEVRDEWATEMAARLREELKTERAELEKNIEDILDREWGKMKDKIREEWERQE